LSSILSNRENFSDIVKIKNIVKILLLFNLKPIQAWLNLREIVVSSQVEK